MRIAPYLGSIRLDELSIDHIRQWLKRLDDEGYAFNSARNAFRLLRQALAAALLERPAKLRENPTDGIKLRTPDSIDDDVIGVALSFAQVNTFLHIVADHRLYALYVVAITTGLRQAELIGLRWPRIEIDKVPYHILVREQIRPVHGKRTRLSPKSKRSKRDVPIDDDLAAVLREHRTLWREEKLRLAREYSTWQTTDLVFPSLVGTSIGHENLRRHFKATLVKAQLDPIRFHDLRHTAGSLMLVQGINIVAVSEILGHSSVAVTAEIYAHSFADQKREAVAAVTNGLRLIAGGVR